VGKVKKQGAMAQFNTYKTTICPKSLEMSIKTKSSSSLSGMPEKERERKRERERERERESDRETERKTDRKRD
jgi:hypothetical protein